MDTMTIGKLAKQVGVGVETIRFYERKGLLEEPARKPSGYRQYSNDDVRRMEFIKRGKALGFSLQDITELLQLRVDPHTTCSDVNGKAMVKIKDIERRIAELESFKKALSSLALECSEKGPSGDCPILDALEK